MKKVDVRDRILGGILGLCVGDALGVPIEFASREELKEDPVTEMIGYGYHNQPPGTWSDDTSLTLCTVDSLCNGYDLEDIANRFLRWFKEGYMTPSGVAFDIGRTTRVAISRLKHGFSPKESGLTEELSNGNGALMRILPVAFFVQNMNLEEQMRITHEITAITHAHPRSLIASGIYVQIIIGLMDNLDPETALLRAKRIAMDFYQDKPFAQELRHFGRVFSENFRNLPEHEIFSDGYVVHTLEASIWCFLNSSSFEEACLRAINLGYDADTTGAVTGGLAGTYYGVEAIPERFLRKLAKAEEIFGLVEKFLESLYK